MAVTHVENVELSPPLPPPPRLPSREKRCGGDTNYTIIGENKEDIPYTIAAGEVQESRRPIGSKEGLEVYVALDDGDQIQGTPYDR